MNRSRYRQVLLVVALILPSIVIAELGRRNFAREHDNNMRRLEDTRKIARFAVVQEISRLLESIKGEVRGSTSAGTDKPSHPALVLFASVLRADGQELLVWRLSVPQFSVGLNKDPEFARHIADASRLERTLDYKAASDGFRAALNILMAREGSATEAISRLENHIHDLALGANIQTALAGLKLNTEEWKPYGKDRLWLSRTIDRTGQEFVIAVRSQDIVRQVQDELKASGVVIPFKTLMHTDSPYVPVEDTWGDLFSALFDLPTWTTLEMSGIPPGWDTWDPALPLVGSKLPGFWIIFDSQGEEMVQDELAEQQRFYSESFALVLALTFVGWRLLLRDSLREARNTEMRAQFVSNVAHELKTPLTAIRTFAETLQIRRSTDPEIQKEFLDTIVSESERLTRLLNNVLDFSRIERDQQKYRMQPTALADVAQSAARTMQFPLSQQGFNFRVDIDDGIPPMRADPDALEQAILNLLSNAMKYSGDSRDIEMRLRSDNGSVLIQVVDHGIGIAPVEWKRIFERYYRVGSPENRSISGSGLGLALVAHVVEGHGGNIEMESVLGAGSTFSIRIPFKGSV